MDFEKEFIMESLEKKKIGSNIFKRKATRRGSGPVITAYDVMSRKDKREYTKPGPLIIYNINEIMKEEKEVEINIPTYVEFTRLSKDEKKELLPRLIDACGGKRSELAKLWGCKVGRIHDWVFRLGLADPENKPKNFKRTRKERAQSQPINASNMDSVSSYKAPRFSLSLNGIYKGNELEARILGITGILDAEKEYDIYFTITEKQ